MSEPIEPGHVMSREKYLAIHRQKVDEAFNALFAAPKSLGDEEIQLVHVKINRLMDK